MGLQRGSHYGNLPTVLGGVLIAVEVKRAHFAGNGFELVDLEGECDDLLHRGGGAFRRTLVLREFHEGQCSGWKRRDGVALQERCIPQGPKPYLFWLITFGTTKVVP